MKAETRDRHERRIHTTVAYLQRCIAEGAPIPTLDATAALACLSPFHFHRLWRAALGETLGRTLTRLRLACAVQRLVAGDTVAGAAFAVGYGSAQALSRAFRQTLAVSPGAVRGQDALAASLLERLGPPNVAGGHARFDVEIVTLAPFEVVALRRRGPFADLDVAYGQLFAWAEGAGVVAHVDALIGVPRADHRDVPARGFMFDAALRMPVPASLPSPIRRLLIDGGRHARLRHVGPYDGLEAATDDLLAQWWPVSGERLRAAPIHYHFLDDPEQVTEADLRADILLPLEG